MLIAVNFHLQANGLDRWHLRLHAEQHRVVVLFLLGHFVRHPGEYFSEPEHDGLDWARMNLHEVDILAVSDLWLQVQLMKCRPSTERQILSEELVAEYADQCLQIIKSCSTMAGSVQGACSFQAMMDARSIIFRQSQCQY